MYFYFTVYPDVTSHCSFFHTFVPMTQTLQIFMEILKVSARTRKPSCVHVQLLGCRHVASWWQDSGGRVTHPTRFSTRVWRVACLSQNVSSWNAESPDPGPGGSLLSHQLIDNTKILKQKSFCTSASNFSSDPRGKKLQFVDFKWNRCVRGRKQVCVFEHVHILTFGHRNGPRLLQKNVCAVCDERAFIYGVIVNLSSLTYLAALRGNVPTLIWWFVFFIL